MGSVGWCFDEFIGYFSGSRFAGSWQGEYFSDRLKFANAAHSSRVISFGIRVGREAGGHAKLWPASARVGQDSRALFQINEPCR